MALSKIASAAIQDASVAAGDLASGAAVANIGFTPPNLTSYVTYSSLGGGYTNGTWYPLFNSTNITSSGVYLIDFYFSTFSAGGSMYSVSGVTSPFPFYAGGTNAGDVFSIPVIFAGHATGGNSIAMRMRTSYNADGKTYIDMQYNGASLSGMNGTSGKEGYFYVRRLY
jgi:hypothetical protein